MSSKKTTIRRKSSAGDAIITTAIYYDSITKDSFSSATWESSGAKRHTSTGRTPVLIADHGSESWVMRHYSRGGLVARFVYDHYVWLGVERTRAFREFRLLHQMTEWQLPVPYPVAARVSQAGLIYQADIITRFIPETQALSAYLRHEGVGENVWRRIGQVVAELHSFGVDHPDLTAHNILVDASDGVHIVDFDNAVIRSPGAWRENAIARLERSLRKVAMETGTDFSDVAWQWVLSSYAGYRS